MSLISFPLLDRTKKRVYFLFLSIFILINSFFIIRPNIYGDGMEYFLMTEAINNHLSLDIQKEDIQAFQQNLLKTPLWSDHWKSITNSIIHKFEFNESLTGEYGLYTNKNNQTYSYHFWFYSLISSPINFFLKLFNGNPLRLFMIVNSLIFLSVQCLILFYFKFSLKKSILISLFHIFSPVLWYLSWTGPEVLIASAFFISIICVYEEKYFQAIILSAVASLHAPPIAFATAFIALYLISKELKWMVILKTGISSSIVAIPSAFYFINFGVMNLILEAGYVDSNNINLNRLLSFYFDLNQGLILGIPLILILSIVIYYKKLKSKQLSWDLFLLPLALSMTIPGISQTNWNSGCFVIQRYGIWISIPILLFVLYNHTNLNKFIIASALIIQIFVIIDFKGLYNEGWEYTHQNRYAKFALAHFPQIYNPDPEIFGERTLYKEGISASDSPIVWWTPNHLKVMVHKSKINELPEQYKKANQMKNLNFVNDWAYINIHGKF